VDGQGRGRVGRRRRAVRAPPRVTDNGSSPRPSDQNGYSIVEAESLEEAKKLLKGHPFLTEGKGRFSVEIFELAPMSM